MFYVPTSELDSSRLPDAVEGLDTEDVLLERKPTGNRVNVSPLSKVQEHMAEVTVAMLYFACGGMDESHNIVLPYSWPSPMTSQEEEMTIHMSGGRPPIQGIVQENMQHQRGCSSYLQIVHVWWIFTFPKMILSETLHGHH